jgi:hypothetical protein
MRIFKKNEAHDHPEADVPHVVSLKVFIVPCFILNLLLCCLLSITINPILMGWAAYICEVDLA